MNSPWGLVGMGIVSVVELHFRGTWSLWGLSVGFSLAHENMKMNSILEEKGDEWVKFSGRQVLENLKTHFQGKILQWLDLPHEACVLFLPKLFYWTLGTNWQGYYRGHSWVNPPWCFHCILYLPFMVALWHCFIIICLSAYYTMMMNSLDTAMSQGVLCAVSMLFALNICNKGIKQKWTLLDK